MGRIYALRKAIGWALALLVIAAVGYGPAQTLRARLPDPLNANRHITVITDATRRPPVGTPLVRIDPRLEVLGVVEGVEAAEPAPAPGDYVLRVSLFPEGEALLRDDAELSLRETTPDLLEIVATHLTPERRAEIAARAQAWYGEHQAAIDRTLARVKAIAERELGADELGRKLLEDPLIHAAVSDAIEREVTSRIDWDRVASRALESEAAGTAGELLFEAGAFSSAWAGIREGYAARWRTTFGDEQPPEEEDGFFNPLSIFVPRWHNARRAAISRAGEDILEAYPGYRARLHTELGQLGRELASEEDLEHKGFDAARALVRDEALREALIHRHGPEAWERVQRLAKALGEDEQLRALSRQTIDSALELFAGFLRELSLDAEGAGPNPLLVAFMRARLLRKTEPTLIVDDPGVGAPVTEGQRFVSRAR